jgi:hypothetical protein
MRERKKRKSVSVATTTPMTAATVDVRELKRATASYPTLRSNVTFP